MPKIDDRTPRPPESSDGPESGNVRLTGRRSGVAGKRTEGTSPAHSSIHSSSGASAGVPVDADSTSVGSLSSAEGGARLSRTNSPVVQGPAPASPTSVRSKESESNDDEERPTFDPFQFGLQNFDPSLLPDDSHELLQIVEAHATTGNASGRSATVGLQTPPPLLGSESGTPQSAIVRDRNPMALMGIRTTVKKAVANLGEHLFHRDAVLTDQNKQELSVGTKSAKAINLAWMRHFPSLKKYVVDGHLAVGHIPAAELKQLSDANLLALMQALNFDAKRVGVRGIDEHKRELEWIPASSTLVLMTLFAEERSLATRLLKSASPGVVSHMTKNLLETKASILNPEMLKKHLRGMAAETTGSDLHSAFSSQGPAMLDNGGSLLAIYMRRKLRTETKDERDATRDEFSKLLHDVFGDIQGQVDKKLPPDPALAGAVIGMQLGACMKCADQVEKSAEKRLERIKFGIEVTSGALQFLDTFNPVGDVVETLAKWSVEHVYAVRYHQADISQFQSGLEIQVEKCAAYLGKAAKEKTGDEAREIQSWDVARFSRWISIAIHANGFR